jgi:hemerythrin superfamily protein
MDAITLLEQQHREVEKFFEQFEKAENPGRKSAAFVMIADTLAAHSTIEEKIFYPAVYVGELKDLLKEAVEEHLSAKRVIADLLDMKPSDPNFDAKVKVLKEQIEHHVEEEEGELFPKVKKDFSKEELSSLGAEMERMFKELKEGEPREDVSSQTDEAAPLQ